MLAKETVENMIKNKKAVVLKVNQKKGTETGYVKTVLINDEKLKLCPYCGMYWELDNFTKVKRGYHSKCKPCRAEQSKKQYYEDINTNIRLKYYSLAKRTKNKKHVCSLEDFTNFYMNKKDVYTGRTLAEDFKEPHPNKLLRLSIDHIIPVSEGGKTTIDNLMVVPTFINQAKANSSYKEWKEVLDFMHEHFK